MSVRVGNTLFYIMDKNRRRGVRLQLNKILELIWLFIYGKCTVREAANVTNHGIATVIEWFHKCRRVCSDTIELLPKFVGTYEAPVKIDKSYSLWNRKYNRGRIMYGDSSNDYEDIADWNSQQLDDWEDSSNFGNGRSDWRCVVGIYSSVHNVRFFRVRNRAKETLTSIITKHVAAGTVIWTNEFPAYKSVSSLGHTYQTANHSQKYIDPVTGVHTQRIKRVWIDSKSWYKRLGVIESSSKDT